MRKDLVEEALAEIAEELFEDVLYTHAPAEAVTIEKAIFGVERMSERYGEFGTQMREVTHVTRALKAKFPDLTRGDILSEGTAYKVLDWEPIGDGRFEVLIGLVPA